MGSSGSRVLPEGDGNQPPDRVPPREMSGDTRGVPAARSVAELPCVGRDEELALILAGLRRAERSQGSCWLVTGPSGIGKSHLLRRVGELAEQRGFEVRRGFGLEGSVTPLLHFRQALPPEEGVAGPTGETGAGPTDSEGALAAHVDLEIVNILRAVERASRERPQLIVLDDLESADAESLRCLDLLSRAIRGSRAVVLGAARVDRSPSDSSRFARALARLRQEGIVRWIELPPLGSNALDLILAQILSRSLEEVRSSPELKDVARLCGGSPYFLVELVSAWIEGRPANPEDAPVRGVLLPPSPGPPSTPSLPAPIERVLRSRLVQLDPSTLHLLGLGAQLGRTFQSDGVAFGAGSSPRTVAAKLTRLSAAGWPISAVPARSATYSFGHQLVQTLLRRSEEFRPEISELLRLAEWSANHHPEDPGTEARLRQLSGDRSGAINCLRRAVQPLLARGAYGSVLALLVGEDGPFVASDYGSQDLAELALTVAGQLRLRLESFWVGALLQTLPVERFPPALRWTTLSWLVESTAFRDNDGARRWLKRLEADEAAGAPGVPPDAPAVLCYLRALCTAYAGSGTPAAHAELTRAAAELDDGAHEFERCRVLYLQIALLLHTGPTTKVRRLVGQARRLLARAPRELRELRLPVVSAESELAFREGDLGRARRIQGGLVSEYRRRGLLSFEGRALLTLANFEYGFRETDASRGHLRRAEEIFTALGNPEFAAHATVLQGWVAILDGEWTEAKRRFRMGLQLEPSGDMGGARRGATIGTALADAELGSPRLALRRLTTLREAASQSASYRLEYYCALAQVHELCGEIGESRAVLAEAERTIRAPPCERAEVLAQLSRWEERYGSAAGRRRWSRSFARLIRRPRRAVLAAWKGIGFRGRDPPSGTPSETRRPTTPRSQGRAAPVGPQLLREFLRQRPEPTAAGAKRAQPGLTEAELATRTGMSRSRFSRALRRLCEEGSLERVAVRPVGASRRLFLYQLTAEGERRARALAEA